MFKSDIEIAQDCKISPIEEIAFHLGINKDSMDFYGNFKAKLNLNLIDENSIKNKKLILTTAINPTPAGEGKTTTTIGLADALKSMNKNVAIALREPSLGPVFGVKGGATGGGYSQVVPMEDINLHFTGDLHAIGAANNLLAAMLDNHIFQGNILNIDPRRIVWRRAVDMNDRQLRYLTSGLNGKANGMPREDGFDITVASEVMAIFCLAQNLSDLKERLGKIIVAYSYDSKPITAKDIKANGAMAALLKDALKPNLVQTLEKTPVLIHGGPFANIAHGCNSVIATKMALSLADIVVTEAGFGADLGAEKFLDIKSRYSGLIPNVVVLVATVRALKYNAYIPKEDLNKENLNALNKGIENLYKHIENLTNVYKLPVVVAINQFPTDSDSELDLIKNACNSKNIPVSISQVWEKGSDGGIELAKEVLKILEKNEKSEFNFAYPLNISIDEKIKMIAQKIYGADDVIFSKEAIKQIQDLSNLGFSELPICIAKTQYSFSDDAKKLGRPKNFKIEIKELKVSAGAGFIVAVSGNILKMPGLPKKPAAENIDIDENGIISGLF